ncbi:MAG: diguanylate cyclase [Acidobacteria bacterium]|nr:MAG: diguanylate cyclase [Acidobacteriota bacterium]
MAPPESPSSPRIPTPFRAGGRDPLRTVVQLALESRGLEPFLAAVHEALAGPLGVTSAALLVGQVPTGVLSPRFVAGDVPVYDAAERRLALAERVVTGGCAIRLTPEGAQTLAGGGTLSLGPTPGVSWLALPVSADGSRFGAVVLTGGEDSFDEDATELVRLTAGLVGLAVQRSRAEEELREDRNLQLALVQALSDANQGILVLGAAGVLWANEAAARLTGYTSTQLARFGSILDLLPAEERPKVSRALREETPPAVQTAFHLPGGSRRDVLLAIRPMRFRGQKAQLATFDDLTPALSRTKTDPVTALPNRAALAETAEREWRRAHRQLHEGERPGVPSLREPGALSLLLLEVQDLAAAAERYGPEGAETLLRHAAEAMRTCLRTSDFLGRLDGPQFFALLPDTGAEGARRTAARLAEAVAAAGPPEDEPAVGTPRVAIGTASASRPEEATYEELLARAESDLAATRTAVPPGEGPAA